MTIRELEKLMYEYGKDILSFCIHLTGNISEGEELYQEVFLKAMDKLSSIQADNNPKSYLLGMALKIYNGEKRKYARHEKIVPMSDYNEYIEETVSVPDDNATTENRILEDEEKQIVNSAVCALPEKYKTVILLYYMEDLQLEQIAKILHVPKGTVASRLHKAKDILKQRLEDYYG